ncbi:hypothetical protein [Nocardiopsis alba]|uniref:hypothetical protein n=1 Tax=Nocardiopsis alba TaxID=53437 RepID=UPI00340A2756
MTEDEERSRKYWENIARIEREEKLERRIESVWHAYKYLAHVSDRESSEGKEFARLRDYYRDLRWRKYSLSREEEDRLIEECPKIVERLEREHGL